MFLYLRPRTPYPLPPLHTVYVYGIQGADNKLVQFFIQDIYATAKHRICLRHSLESCPSLVWCNVNRPSLAKNIPAEHQILWRCAKSFARHTAKIIQPGWRPTWKNHWSKEIWPPSSPDVILLILLCGANLRERSIKSLITPWPPSGPRSWR